MLHRCFYGVPGCSSGRMLQKLGVEGKGWSIFDGDDDFHLLNKNNSNKINNSSPVFRSDLVVWVY